MTAVPFVDLRAQARELHDELNAVFESVTSRGAYTLGPECAAFEAAFAEYCGARFCAGVSSGTDAVRLALQAAGVGPGDECVGVAIAECAPSADRRERAHDLPSASAAPMTATSPAP